MALVRHRTLIFISVLLTQPVRANMNYTSQPSMSTSSQSSIVDTDLIVAFNIAIGVISFAILALASWIITMIFMSGGHKKNPFVYLILSLAIADVVLGAAQFVEAPLSVLTFLSLPYSLPLFEISECIFGTATTQHYLTIAVIASERLFAMARPLQYHTRGPPRVTVGVLSAFFFVNTVVSVAGNLTDPNAYTYTQFANVMYYWNVYAALVCVGATVLIYAALVVVVRRHVKRKVGAKATSIEAQAMQEKQDRQLKMTKTVLKVGAVFFATAFVFNVVLIVDNELILYNLFAWGPASVVNSFCYVPLMFGEFIDLLIFAVKIDEIRKPSIACLKRMHCLARFAEVGKGSTSTRRTGVNTASARSVGNAPTAGGAMQLAEVQM